MKLHCKYIEVASKWLLKKRAFDDFEKIYFVRNNFGDGIMIFDKGRVCIVRRGRDFGKVCYILEKPKTKDFDLVVEGPKLKKSKKNIAHLWPINSVVESIKELEKVKL